MAMTEEGFKRCVYCRTLSSRGVPREARFWNLVNKNGPNGCMVWTAAKNWASYGLFCIRPGKLMIAHRYAWMISGRPLPDYSVNETLDHLCNNRLCVNVEHLRVLTISDNVKRAWARRASSD